jgi:hypothetical protein
LPDSTRHLPYENAPAGLLVGFQNRRHPRKERHLRRHAGRERNPQQLQNPARETARDPQTVRGFGRRRHQFSHERLHHRPRETGLDVPLLRWLRVRIPTY